MYFDWKTYLLVFRRAFREPAAPRRRRWLVVALALLFPLLAVVDFVFFALDHLLFPGFRKVEIKSPVFVVGNARSGTTNIHRLLCGDPRFSYFRTWQILLPSLLQKKLVVWIGAFDSRFLGGALAERIGGREDATLAKARRMHDWRLTGAEEDGFLALHTSASGTISVLFPYNRALQHLTDLDRLATPEHRRRSLDFQEACVKRQIHFDGGNKMLLSKNPAFVGRMRSLLERYPDAKFICPVRHPYETIPSLINMLSKGWHALGCDPADIADAEAFLREHSIDTYRRAFEVLDELPESSYAVISFQELIEQPRATVEKIYARFGWTIGPDYAAFLKEQEETRARRYRSEHHYDTQGLGPPREELHESLAPLFERFGWEKEGPGASPGLTAIDELD